VALNVKPDEKTQNFHNLQIKLTKNIDITGN